MTRVLLMRHAKSDWGNVHQSDKERPLNGRGREAAPAVARALIERAWKPDLVLCSAATRTMETWNLMASEWPDTQIDPAFHDVLYLAPSHVLEQAVGTYAAKLENSGRDDGTLLVLGHNPGLEDLAADWAKTLNKAAQKENGPDAEKISVGHFSTASCAVFEGQMEGHYFVPTKFCEFLKAKELLA